MIPNKAIVARVFACEMPAPSEALTEFIILLYIVSNFYLLFIA
jgi:hypothetical protein